MCNRVNSCSQHSGALVINHIKNVASRRGQALLTLWADFYPASERGRSTTFELGNVCQCAVRACLAPTKKGLFGLASRELLVAGDREAHLKPRLAWFGFELDLAAVVIGDDAVADHQAQARAGADSFGGEMCQRRSFRFL